jgi:hypothetical protein
MMGFRLDRVRVSYVNDALLLAILRKATEGPECYRPKDHRVPTLREFQLMVDSARQAHRDGLIEGIFQLPSKGKITSGLVRSFTVSAITSVGLERLDQLSTHRDRHGSSVGWDGMPSTSK